ncbi:type IV pilin protein [Pseudomonas stutzeri]|uniref:Type IV pilin protein n=1 Tax=Stutzerimonas stutzeri TaxID=316 RepID=A0A2N8SRC4_STUST|nr:type IV pilin protein [Stutzerimonas stutzeri]MCQ4250947.1 type IV pilin protein [Stutzerimonas stutzeri]PNG05043.1 type IV pilin protein [Stutzerimonas stutzeri]
MARYRGFTLIELMIVVGIVGILAAIAYPNYREYIDRSNRTEGQALLNDAAASQERFFAQNNRYVTVAADIAKLGLRGTTGTTVKSDNGKYTLTIGTNANDGGYTLTATQNFADAACGNLSLNARGIKGNSGTRSVEECWK